MQLGVSGKSYLNSNNITFTPGPLRVNLSNPRYFTDGSGKAVYLTGSHTWNNLSDSGAEDPPAPFDYNAYLDFLKTRNHNISKSFMRGYNPIIMDDLSADSAREEARKAAGYTLTYANKMNLAFMTPQNDLSSTAYCLANPGSEYLIYQPVSGSFTLNLLAGKYTYEWFNPNTGTIPLKGTITASDGKGLLKAPFKGDAVLYIHKQ